MKIEEIPDGTILAFDTAQNNGPIISEDNNRFTLIEKAGNGSFVDKAEYTDSLLSPFNYRLGKVLFNTPRDYTILPAHQDPFFLAESPFFYTDSGKSFFVLPEDSYTPFGFVANDSSISAGVELMDSIFTSNPGTKTLLANTLVEKKLSLTHGDGSYYSIRGTERRLPPHRKYSLKESQNIQSFTDDFSGKVGAALAKPIFTTIALNYQGMTYAPSYWQGKKYRFFTNNNPFSGLFIIQVNRYGLVGVLDPGQGNPADAIDQYLIRQGADNTNPDFIAQENYFQSDYSPGLKVDSRYPKDVIDFNLEGTYSAYNWEVFFHIPLMIATQLSQNQRFEEAHKWFQYIFDPTMKDGDNPKTYWKTRPFYEYADHIGSSVFDYLEYVDSADGLPALLKQWRKNPFSPHLIARFRKLAYMKNVVMKYLDNLIAWGDMLFRRDTIESINEASQYYILAAQILGKEPVFVKKEEEEADPDYQQTRLAFSTLNTFETSDSQIDGQIHMLFSLILFGGAPKNEKLLGYWKTVGDRLYKIRNCMNIEGVVRSLDLFAPPIDPALLVRAAAAGLDFGSVLNDLAAPTPTYRYPTLQQKAVEFCGDVKTLGSSLLLALEKKDAAHMEVLRTRHEVAINDAIKQVRQDSVDEAKENLASLKVSQSSAEKRVSHYQGLIDKGLISHEEQYDEKSEKAQNAQDAAAKKDRMAAIMYSIPNVTIAWPPSTTFGGSNLGAIQNAKASEKRRSSAKHSFGASKAQTGAVHKRREQDWNLQLAVAEKDVEQLERQIIAAEIRVAISQKELDNHKLQMKNTKEVEAFLKNRYTSEQLYSWMVGKISGVYFQAYQLAYEMARKAEKAYKAELFDDDRSYIKFDNWDSLHKGLLAGEKLHNDLKRLDSAYFEKNKRQLEMTRNIPLSVTDSDALDNIKDDTITGPITIDLTASNLFKDFDSYYAMRIKTVSVTIPCVAGPYDSVSARLSLQSDTYYRDTEEADAVVNSAGVQSMVTSSAMDDSGMFELNFRDERFLPFEGAGVQSSWSLQFGDNITFDRATISDVIFHIKYTAKQG